MVLALKVVPHDHVTQRHLVAGRPHVGGPLPAALQELFDKHAAEHKSMESKSATYAPMTEVHGVHTTLTCQE